MSRQDEIQSILAKSGLRMCSQLGMLNGEGGAITDIASGEPIDEDDERWCDDVLALAEEWSQLDVPRYAGRDPLPEQITLHVFETGDATVGLPGHRCTVTLDASSYEGDDRHDYLSQVREGLRTTFTQIWGSKPAVWTDQEMETDQDAALPGQTPGG